jgi:hypothetical protein
MIVLIDRTERVPDDCGPLVVDCAEINWKTMQRDEIVLLYITWMWTCDGSAISSISSTMKIRYDEMIGYSYPDSYAMSSFR